MMVTDQVVSRVTALAGELSERQKALLETLCGSTVTALTARLKPGFTVEDCEEVFVTAAGFYVLAALEGLNEAAGVEEFKAGDLTVRQAGGQAQREHSLQRQAEQLMKPYLQDGFAFAGV